MDVYLNDRSSYCQMCGGNHIKLCMVGDNKELFVWKCFDCDYTPVANNRGKSNLITAFNEWCRRT